MKNKTSKQLLLLMAIWSTALTSIFAQNTNAFADAVALKKFVLALPNAEPTIARFTQEQSTTIDISEAKEILSRYCFGEEENLGDYFLGNPFINGNDGFILLPNQYKSSAPEVRMMSNSSGSKASTGQGMGVTQLADGLARFLAKRTKQELNMAFFNQFKRQVDTSFVLQQLFPETRRQLKVIDTELYYFDRYLEGMRESFARDLAVLPSNLRAFLQSNRYDFGMDGASQVILEDMLASGQILLDGAPAYSWFEFMATDASIQYANRYDTTQDVRTLQNAAATFKTINFLSKNLRSQIAVNAAGLRDSNAVAPIWYANRADSLRALYSYVQPSEARKLLNDPILLNLYLGLLYQLPECETIEFAQGNNLRDCLKKMTATKGWSARFATFILRWTDAAEQMDKSAAEQKTLLKNDLKNSESAFYRYADNFLLLAEGGVHFVNDVLLDEKSDTSMVLDLIQGVHHLNSMTFNVRQKQYVYAIHNLSALLDLSLPDSIYSPDRKKSVLRYGVFMASLVEAKTSDEVAYAFEVFSLPVGSSSLKKHAKFSISINAYPGFSGGSEYLTDGRIASADRQKWTISPQASVGLGFNWGFKSQAKLLNKKTNKTYLRPGGSFSLYAPLIDVGGIWAYRLNDKNSADLPALEWENLIAPGLFAIYGWRNNKPVSIGLGMQRGPGLRKVTPRGGVEITSSGYRILAFVAMDIPFTHVFTKER